MAKGAIVEHGTHDELVRKGSIYAGMVSVQQISKNPARCENYDGLGRRSSDLQSISARANESHTQTAEKNKMENQGSHSLWTLARFVYGLNPDDNLLLLSGLCCSVIAGASYPT